MYVYPIDNSNPIFWQGDIIDNFPFFIIGTDNFNILESEDETLKTKRYNIKKDKIKPEDTTDNLIAVEARRQRVMVLSHSCDVQDRETIIFAPVFDISQAIIEKRMTENQAGNLRYRKVNYWFYLPKLEGVMEESYIDFQIIHYIPKDLIIKNLSNRILALTDWGRHHLGWALSDFFGRPIKNK